MYEVMIQPIILLGSLVGSPYGRFSWFIQLSEYGIDLVSRSAYPMTSQPFEYFTKDLYLFEHDIGK